MPEIKLITLKNFFGVSSLATGCFVVFKDFRGKEGLINVFLMTIGLITYPCGVLKRGREVCEARINCRANAKCVGREC